MKDADLYMTKPIESTHDNLIKRLEKIEESGQTALGSGLIVALGAAIKGTQGSRVIICTDGLVNIGFGSVENLEDKKTVKETKDFYMKIGELGKERGVSISIVSIVSEECNLEMLSPLAN
jgi:Mg-chelatase subunit ChlD